MRQKPLVLQLCNSVCSICNALQKAINYAETIDKLRLFLYNNVNPKT